MLKTSPTSMGSTHGLQVVRRLPPPLPPRPDPTILAGGGKRRPTPPPVARHSPPLGTVSPSIARRQMMLFGGDERQPVVLKGDDLERRVDNKSGKPSTEAKQDGHLNKTQVPPPLETNIDSPTRVTVLNHTRTSPVAWRRVTPPPPFETILDSRLPPRRTPHPSLPSLNHAGVPRRKAPATPDGKHGHRKTSSSGEEEISATTSSDKHVIRKQSTASVEEVSSTGHIVIYYEQTSSKCEQNVSSTVTSGDNLVIRKQSTSSIPESEGSINKTCFVETSSCSRRKPVSPTEDTSINRRHVHSKALTRPTLERNTLQASPSPTENNPTPLDHSTRIRNRPWPTLEHNTLQASPKKDKTNAFKVSGTPNIFKGVMAFSEKRPKT
uniref:Uncharacterized protein n=1 Tax=Cacopsylla melanoneura TaxID=428564 RepID=A0A8D8TDN0_9HEMI